MNPPTAKTVKLTPPPDAVGRSSWGPIHMILLIAVAGGCIWSVAELRSQAEELRDLRRAVVTADSRNKTQDFRAGVAKLEDRLEDLDEPWTGKVRDLEDEIADVSEKLAEAESRIDWLELQRLEDESSRRNDHASIYDQARAARHLDELRSAARAREAAKDPDND